MLPDLLDELCTAVNVYDGVLREDAALLLTETCHAARGVLTTLRHLNLGWIAAERAVQAANLVGDPLLMAACMYNLVEVYSTSGANQPARQLAQGALGRLSQAGTAPREEWSLAGMLHLKLGLAAAVLGDRQCAYEHLNEAKAAAGRVGDGHNDFETMFGPTEVAIHRLGIAAELGDGTEALASLRNLDPASIRAKRRQSRLHIDIARTQINGGKHESALRSLVTAEQASPEYARNHPATREIVSVMLHRERRTIRSELRSLADRIGIL